MSIETNLNVAPYFNDYDEEKGFYKVLFRPGVSVQARELTQLQDILQTQVERVGNHIFKSGTIVSGVNFQFYPRLNYVKILDNQSDGAPVAIASYLNLYTRNSSNLEAKIVNFKLGFQSTDPEMNYLYLRYLNSGDNGNTVQYTAGEELTVFSKNYPVFDYNVIGGGTLFSNTDSIQVVSALLVSNSNIDAGGNITQTIGVNTANLQVIEANNNFSITVGQTVYNSSDGYTILKVKPQDADLSNTLVTSARWTVSANAFITQGSNSAFVIMPLGSGASATITTDASGVITDVSPINLGAGYVVEPQVAVRSSTGTRDSLNITPKLFKAQILVADSTFTGGNANPVGYAYGFGVTEGTIYQKGYFLKVDPQTIVVNSYSTNVHEVSVGFMTTESIVNNNVDDSLLDNATGTPNFSAPGANRLKLTPTLTVANTTSSISNNSFFTLVEFRDGQPFKQLKNPLYNILAKEFERRTDETSGSFVINTFDIQTKDRAEWSNTQINVVVDPGVAYINGKRVQTEKNVFLPVDRASETLTLENQTLGLNFGNYVSVNNLAGVFDTQTLKEVKLYDTAGQFYNNTYNTIQQAQVRLTRQIGTARIRSVVLDSGTPGTATAVYRMYLFDISMNRGWSFSEVKGIYFDGTGTDDGIADCVQSVDPSSGKVITVLKDSYANKLIFDIGTKGINRVNGVTYNYRTTVSTANISVDGIVSHTSTDLLRYGNSAVLSEQQKESIILIPRANVQSTNTVTVNATINQNTITGTSLTTYFRSGDTIKVYDPVNESNTFLFASISSVTNSTHMSMNKVWPFNTLPNIRAARFLQAYVPVPIDDRVIANTSANGTVLSLYLGGTANTLTSTSLTPVYLTYDARKLSVAPTPKSVVRNNLVKISLANNAGSTNGPWCLGVPDVFRLNNVYVAGNSSVNVNSTNITSAFYVKNGQNDNYYGHSYLAKHYSGNEQSRPLNEEEYLLVDFDFFDVDTLSVTGYHSINSYSLATNNSPKSELANHVNILEVPNYRDSTGNILQLENTIDFRPRVTKTAAVTNNISVATVDPANTIAFASGSVIVPVPESDFIYNYRFYLSRKDRVVLDSESNLSIVKGTPAVNPVPAPETSDVMTIGIVNIPPYPSIPQSLDSNQINFLINRIVNDGVEVSKQQTYQITDTVAPNQYRKLPRRYSMADIGRLERRIDNLEYYNSLNLLEKKTSDLNIPSSLNPLLNRFKNGFFVEQFDDNLQLDLSDPQSTAVVDQSSSKLYPMVKSLNIQNRFNYSQSNTLNALYSEDALSEPGYGKWGESVLMLPANGTYELVNQTRFTSAISGVGGDVQFAGTMTINPESLKVIYKGQVKITDTIVVQKTPTVDTSTSGAPIGTDPFYVLSTENSIIVERQTANVFVEAVNVGNATLAYTITGVSASDINVPLTGTISLTGNLGYSVGKLSITANGDLSTESTETITIEVNTTPANTSIQIQVLDDGITPEYFLNANTPTGTDVIQEGQSITFRVTSNNVSNGTIVPYRISGIGITSSDVDVPLVGNLTIDSTGSNTIVVTTAQDFVREGNTGPLAGTELLKFELGGGAAGLSRTIQVIDVDRPVYSLSANLSSINEGDSVKFTLLSTNTANGTTVPYTITGIIPGDADTPLSGTLTFNNNSANTILITKQTMASDGNRTATFTANLQLLSANSLSVPVSIVDTTPKTLELTSNTTILKEGSAVLFTLQANGFNGNVFNYNITGNPVVVNTAVCVSVIDEADGQVTSTTISSDWNAFRNAYPNRIFWLLQPSSNVAALQIPSAFNTDPKAFRAEVNRDNGNTSNRTDWFNTIGLASYPAGTVVSLSIDTSLSLGIDDVQASYDFFKVRCANAGIIISEQNFNSERWAQPHSRPLPTPNVISVVTSSDFVGSPTLTNGTFGTVTSNTITFTLTANADRVVELAEVFTLNVFSTALNRSVSKTICLYNEDPIPRIYIASNTGVARDGDLFKITLTANGFNGNVFNYTITGVDAADVSLSSLTGSFPAISSNSANIIFTANSDIEKTFRITVNAASFDNQYPNTTVRLLDEYVAPPPGDPDPVPAVSYLLSASQSQVNEGQNVTMFITSTGIGNATYAYTISGNNITANDFTTPLTGNVTLSGNTTIASCTFVVTTRIDSTSVIEGNEVFTFTVGGAFNQNTNVTIREQAPPVTYTLTSNKDVVDEGNSVVFTLQTTGVAPGTYSYNITGNNINQSDFTTNTIGTITTTGNVFAASANLTINVANDSTDFESEVFTLIIGNGANVSKSITINPTQPPAPTISADRYVIRTSTSSNTIAGVINLTVINKALANSTTCNYYVLSPVLRSNGEFRYWRRSSNYVVTAELGATGINTTERGNLQNNIQIEQLANTLTFSSGVATRSFNFKDDGNGNQETFIIRAIFSNGHFIDTPLFAFSDGGSLGTWTVSSTSSLLRPGSTANVNISTSKAYNGTKFNYTITGVTSAEICGLPLTGSIFTYNNESSEDLFIKTTGSGLLSITANANISNTKTVTLKIDRDASAIQPATNTVVISIAPASVVPSYSGRVSFTSVAGTSSYTIGAPPPPVPYMAIDLRGKNIGSSTQVLVEVKQYSTSGTLLYSTTGKYTNGVTNNAQTFYGKLPVTLTSIINTPDGGVTLLSEWTSDSATGGTASNFNSPYSTKILPNKFIKGHKVEVNVYSLSNELLLTTSAIVPEKSTLTKTTLAAAQAGYNNLF